MAKRLTVQQRLGRLHARGFTDRQIAVALGRGERGESFVQKTRTGRKSGGSLAAAVARLDTLTARRKQPTATPLPTITAARRPQAVRGRERVATDSGRIYIGTARRTGKFHASKTLHARIARAARRDERVRLTTNWRVGQWMGSRGGPGHAGQYTLWDDGITARGALEELERAGYDRDAEGALAALIAESSTISDTWYRVEGLVSYSLQIYVPAVGWDVDDASEWA